MTYFIESKEQYLEIIKSWKAFVNSNKTVYNSHMMLYNIFRSKKWDRGFSPTTKAIKLANGCDPWQGRKEAIWKIEAGARYGGSYLKELLLPFGDINPEEIKKAWAHINEECKKLK